MAFFWGYSSALWFCACSWYESCCADQIIALSASEQDLFKNLDESCRRAVRKGMDAGLKFEQSPWTQLNTWIPTLT